MASLSRKRGELTPQHALTFTVSMPTRLYNKMTEKCQKKNIGRSRYLQELVERDR